MMINDPNDPYGGGGGGGGGGDGGDGGDPGGPTGGNDPSAMPPFRPDPNGWWEFIRGTWRWVTEPAPQIIRIDP